MRVAGLLRHLQDGLHDDWATSVPSLIELQGQCNTCNPVRKVTAGAWSFGFLAVIFHSVLWTTITPTHMSLGRWDSSAPHCEIYFYFTVGFQWATLWNMLIFIHTQKHTIHTMSLKADGGNFALVGGPCILCSFMSWGPWFSSLGEGPYWLYETRRWTDLVGTARVGARLISSHDRISL